MVGARPRKKPPKDVIKTSVYLTRGEYEDLREISFRRKLSISRIIREAINACMITKIGFPSQPQEGSNEENES